MRFTPAHLEILLIHLKKFVDFEMLNPDYLLSLANDQWSLTYFLDKVSGTSSADLVPKDLMTLVFIAVGFVLVLLLMIILMFVARRHKDFIKS